MGEECLAESKRRKIEDAVLQILKTSDLETITEFSVRSAAAGRLGFALSSLNYRRLVRQLVDSFLLSTAADIVRAESLHRINDGGDTDANADYRTKQRPQQQLNEVGIETVGLEPNYNGKVICKLSDKRRITIHDNRGTTVVSIRDFYIKNGNMLPEQGGNSGVSLNATQWSSFKDSFPSIEEAILRLESQSRSVTVAKQSEADVTNSTANSATEKSQTEAGIPKVRKVVFPPIKRKQNGTERDAVPCIRNEIESDFSASVPLSPTQRQHDTVHAVPLENLIPSKREQTDADRSRSANVAKHSEADVTNSTADSTEKNQTEAWVPNVRKVVFPPKRKQNGTEPDPREKETAGTSEPISRSIIENESDISALSPNQRTQDTLHAAPPENLIPSKRKHTEANCSTSMPSFPAVPPLQLIPIQTTRFDGRNYYSWKHQMEFFLNQANIGYVLSEVCSLNPETNFEERIKKWTHDDYMCRHHILNSLCDNLFQLYSQKCYSAKELWEELKLVYNDDFGTKRSQINKYIHFQMVDGVSILEQVEELHKIADAVAASGTWIEENLHVSVIVSKLPPSWKELRARLMQEEFLPLNMLMHRLRAEEEARRCYREETSSKKDHTTEPRVDARVGMRKNENKRACYSCGKEGHVMKNCPDRKSEFCNKSSGKDNGDVSSFAGTKI